MPLPLRRALPMLAGVALYILASRLGFALAFVDGTVSAVWPPTGVALVLVVLYGPRMVIAVVVGEVIANLWNGSTLGPSLGFAIGNAAEALLARELLRRVGFRPQLDRVRDVFALLGLAAILSTMVSATIATATFLADGLPASATWDVWHTWWLGDLTGDLVVAPLGFLALTTKVGRPDGWHRLEAVGFAVALAGMFVLASRSSIGAGYLALPVLLWGALRFGLAGAALANATLAGAGILTAATAGSELARVAVAERVLYTQNFVGVAAVTTLAIAALLAERARAQEDLRVKQAEAAALAAEQGALRRVATAVARDGSATAIFWTIAAEAAKLLGGTSATIERRKPAAQVTYWTDGREPNGTEISAPIVVAAEVWGRLTVTGVPNEHGERLTAFADLAAIAAARSTDVTSAASPALP